VSLTPSPNGTPGASAHHSGHAGLQHRSAIRLSELVDCVTLASCAAGCRPMTAPTRPGARAAGRPPCMKRATTF
jgi:hypothetical protein